MLPARFRLQSGAMKRPLLGVHASVAGGFPRALERGEALGCDTIQIFVKNANRWQAKPIEPAAAAAFREAHRESPIGPLFAHASYLINLAAVDEKTLSRSRAALADELERCAALGVDGLVLHPGAHLGEGVEAGVAAVAASLDIVFGPLLDRLPDLSVRLLLENTAGQGTVLGHRLEELAAIIEAADCKQHLGVCLDSCHAFAAGYPVHEEGTKKFRGAKNSASDFFCQLIIWS